MRIDIWKKWGRCWLRKPDFLWKFSQGPTAWNGAVATKSNDEKNEQTGSGSRLICCDCSSVLLFFVSLFLFPRQSPIQRLEVNTLEKTWKVIKMHLSVTWGSWRGLVFGFGAAYLFLVLQTNHLSMNWWKDWSLLTWSFHSCSFLSEQAMKICNNAKSSPEEPILLLRRKNVHANTESRRTRLLWLETCLWNLRFDVHCNCFKSSRHKKNCKRGRGLR